MCNALRELNYEPILFKKRGNKEKGVDIALTKEMLINSFNHNFDVALLIATDADYISLINEVKRYGVILLGAFFSRGLSPGLHLSFNHFKIIDHFCPARPKPGLTGY
ncbi:MAG: NYN domain-containing protein [Syntrophobacterales bacterium]|nr:NYN domain-containing protein [Syntrophobacterales bacterium]